MESLEHVFSKSALRANSVSKMQFPSVVFLCVCAITENPLPVGLETSGQRAYRLYKYTSRYFFCFLLLFYKFLGFEVLFGFL